MKNAQLTFDEPKKTVILEFQGFLTAEQFKQVYINAINLIEEKQAKYFFIDASKERIIPTGTEEWLVSDLFPYAEKIAQRLGYRLRAARAESEDIFNRLASERSIQHFTHQSSQFDFQNFPNIEAALSWLYKD
ncbi:MAG: hypothetical protein OHK0045_11000 [Raineya sp.]